MRVAIVDPSAFTPPYDHALCSALAEAGADVELLTSRFSYGEAPKPDRYVRKEIFYRRSHRESALGPRSRLALAMKLAEHVPGMLRCKRLTREADVVHFQWLPLQQLDWLLLGGGRRPTRAGGGRLGGGGWLGGGGRLGGKGRRGGGGSRPHPALVLTAHDVMPREPRRGQLRAQRMLYDRFDAIVVHSEEGRRRLLEDVGVDGSKVSVIPHGIFTHLAGSRREGGGGAGEIEGGDGRVVLFFGLLRPYKGIDVLLEAWRMLSEQDRAGATLRIVGMPRMDLSTLGLDQSPAPSRPRGDRSPARDGIELTPRFVSDEKLPSWFEGADLVVLPYKEADQSGVLFTALAFGKPLLLSDVGGFPDIAETGAARVFPAGDARALAGELRDLLGSPKALSEMAACARKLGSPDSPLSWQSVAKEHMKLYERLLS